MCLEQFETRVVVAVVSVYVGEQRPSVDDQCDEPNSAVRISSIRSEMSVRPLDPVPAARSRRRPPPPRCASMASRVISEIVVPRRCASWRSRASRSSGSLTVVRFMYASIPARGGSERRPAHGVAVLVDDHPPHPADLGGHADRVAVLGPEWPIFGDALANTVSSLPPRGSPERHLSTYWIDSTLNRLRRMRQSGGRTGSRYPARHIARRPAPCRRCGRGSRSARPASYCAGTGLRAMFCAGRSTSTGSAERQLCTPRPLHRAEIEAKRSPPERVRGPPSRNAPGSHPGLGLGALRNDQDSADHLICGLPHSVRRRATWSPRSAGPAEPGSLSVASSDVGLVVARWRILLSADSACLVGST